MRLSGLVRKCSFCSYLISFRMNTCNTANALLKTWEFNPFGMNTYAKFTYNYL